MDIFYKVYGRAGVELGETANVKTTTTKIVYISHEFCKLELGWRRGENLLLSAGHTHMNMDVETSK